MPANDRGRIVEARTSSARSRILSFDVPDRRQLEVGTSAVHWGGTSHLFEDREEIAADGRRDCALQDLAQRFLCGMHVLRKPQRRTSAIVGAVGAIVHKRAAPESPGEAGHAGQVLMGIRPTPSCDRIAGECQDYSIDHRNFVGWVVVLTARACTWSSCNGSLPQRTTQAPTAAYVI